jgi:hypothetical protein
MICLLTDIEKHKKPNKCDYMNCLLKIRVVEKEALEIITTILIKDNIMCFPHILSSFILIRWCLGVGELDFKPNKEIA